MAVSFLQIWQDLNQSAKIALAVALVVVAGSIWHSCSSQSDLDKFRNLYKQYQDSVTLALRYSDSISAKAKQDSIRLAATQAHSDSLQAKIDKLAVSNAALHHKNDSLATVVLSDTTLSPQARTLITDLRSENDSLRQQVSVYAKQDTTQKSIIALCETMEVAQRKRADSLYTVLGNLPHGPKASDHLLGLAFLPRVSPTATFFIGAAAGLIVESRLK